MKLIILDRDGVINKNSKNYIKAPDEWKAIPGSLESIAMLTKKDYTICIVTNQSGIARKYFDEKKLNNIHDHMLEKIKQYGGRIYKIYYCPHIPTDNCKCRKPAAGMFEQVAKDFNINFNNKKFPIDVNPIFVGDSLCDLELGLSTGCTFYLINGVNSNGNETLKKITKKQFKKIIILKDLNKVVKNILS